MTDRLPPHSPEAEAAVLGCLLLDPKFAVPLATEALGANGEAFYDLRHQTIYAAIVNLAETSTVDVITVISALKASGMYQSVGGTQFLARLPDQAPSAYAIETYLDIVRGKWRLRRLIRAAAEVTQMALDCAGNPDETIDRCEAAILGAVQVGKPEAGTSMRQLVKDAIEQFQAYHENQGRIMGVPSGFVDLDRHTGGFHPGEMVIIAGTTSTGKTSLAMNIVEHVAIEQKLPVGVFSLEMANSALVQRMLCSQARLNMRNVRAGFFTEGDFPRLTNAAGRLASAPIYIDDTGSLSIVRLRAKARRMWQEYKIKLVVIDYIQLATATVDRGNGRVQEVSAIAHGLKGLARELNIPALVLSQLGREFAKEKGARKPRLSDLRDSSDVENDADVVGLLYSPDENEPHADSVAVNLLIAKGRNCGTTDIPLTFLKQFTRFESAAKMGMDDGPTRRPHND